MNLDDLLPHVLKKEVIAHIEDTTLYIHNRKRYPFVDETVPCTTVEQIAQALRAMVTQGGGVLQVALRAMIFIATLMQERIIECSYEKFKEQGLIVVNARVTNTTARRVFSTIIESLEEHPEVIHQYDIVNHITSLVQQMEDHFDSIYDYMSDIGADLINDGDGIFTTCFAEHTFILSLVKAQKMGKSIKAWIPETRPYLQGAHLTAPSLVEMSIDTTLMSDAMAAHYIDQGDIQRYMSAVDALCMDGSAVNKVGTLNNAIICSHFNLPFHVFAISPDPTKQSSLDSVMEERNPEELLTFEGKRVSAKGVKGVYPAFDRIPSRLISGIITPKGLYAPHQINDIFNLEGRR
jgi:methylthioribose-1-phosphate isomerase